MERNTKVQYRARVRLGNTSTSVGFTRLASISILERQKADPCEILVETRRTFTVLLLRLSSRTFIMESLILAQNERWQRG